MPLINGMKMACEPCIRGHRSTKCTHANERLMVPVRKPGRPLSACPHPRDQTCGCGSVTAAIPRKQTCHCGTSQPTQPVVQPPTSNTPNSALADIPSPTKTSFKVDKRRQMSSRKQSFDPNNLERMDMNQINIIPGERPQNVPVSLPIAYPAHAGTPSYSFPQQYTSIQPQYPAVPMQIPPQQHSIDGTVAHANSMNGFGNSMIAQNGLTHVVESPLATPTLFASGEPNISSGSSFGFSKSTIRASDGDTNSPSQGGSCCAPAKSENGPKHEVENGDHYGMPSDSRENGDSGLSTTEGSCCTPKKSHSQSSSSSSFTETKDVQKPNCCSTQPLQQSMTQEHMSTAGTPQIPHQLLTQNGMVFSVPFYPQYPPETTVFSYPATYGSFQNPLQPTAWRQNVRENNFAHVPGAIPQGPLPFNAPLMPEPLGTIHTCSCGDSCQCIGCAAHPYNDATQEYVRSAWESMNTEQPSNELFADGHHTNGSGNITMQAQTSDSIASPTAHTPSSTASGNGDEQSLSANDFFFVNYSFPSVDGCGGDTYSCPCGDDCQCIGCEIHKGGSVVQ